MLSPEAQASVDPNAERSIASTDEIAWSAHSVVAPTSQPATQVFVTVAPGSTQPALIDQIAKISQGIVTPCFALLGIIIASIIAYRQWKVAKNKLKLDLYDKRFAIFKAYLDFIDRSLNSPADVDVAQFGRETAAATFLFGREVNADLSKATKVLKRWVGFRDLRPTSSTTVDEAERIVREGTQAYDEMVELISRSAAIFRPYLSFEHLDNPIPPRTTLALDVAKATLDATLKASGSASAGLARALSGI